MVIYLVISINCEIILSMMIIKIIIVIVLSTNHIIINNLLVLIVKMIVSLWLLYLMDIPCKLIIIFFIIKSNYDYIFLWCSISRLCRLTLTILWCIIFLLLILFLWGWIIKIYEIIRVSLLVHDILSTLLKRPQYIIFVIIKSSILSIHFR